MALKGWGTIDAAVAKALRTTAFAVLLTAALVDVAGARDDVDVQIVETRARLRSEEFRRGDQARMVGQLEREARTIADRIAAARRQLADLELREPELEARRVELAARLTAVETAAEEAKAGQRRRASAVYRRGRLGSVRVLMAAEPTTDALRMARYLAAFTKAGAADLREHEMRRRSHLTALAQAQADNREAADRRIGLEQSIFADEAVHQEKLASLEAARGALAGLERSAAELKRSEHVLLAKAVARGPRANLPPAGGGGQGGQAGAKDGDPATGGEAARQGSGAVATTGSAGEAGASARGLAAGASKRGQREEAQRIASAGGTAADVPGGETAPRKRGLLARLFFGEPEPAAKPQPNAEPESASEAKRAPALAAKPEPGPKRKPPPAPVLQNFLELKGKLGAPVSGSVIARYGERHPSGSSYRGIIVRAPAAAGVRSVASGEVVFAGSFPAMGKALIIAHGGRYHTVYGRLESLSCDIGDRVARGATVGRLAGADSDLHFEVRAEGKPIDPLPWFRGGHAAFSR